MTRNKTEAGEVPLDDSTTPPLSFVDFERSSTLVGLVVAFGLLVVGLARWQGLRSLASLGIS